MRLDAKERSAAIEARAHERKISLTQAAQELSLDAKGRKQHIASTVRGLTVCGRSSFALDCVPSQSPQMATCLRCRSYLSG